jgi:glycerol uptake facilitator-like aquaporin
MFQFFSQKKYMYKYLAEFLGTLFLMYVIIATGNPLAVGAALALSILLTANISGGHINPAVTIAMAAAGKIEVNEIIPYILSQVFGALVAVQVWNRYKI